MGLKREVWGLMCKDLNGWDDLRLKTGTIWKLPHSVIWLLGWDWLEGRALLGRLSRVPARGTWAGFSGVFQEQTLHHTEAHAV